MQETGEQRGSRKVCTDLQGAVGFVSPRGAVGVSRRCIEQETSIYVTVMPTVGPALLGYTERDNCCLEKHTSREAKQ